MKMENINIKKRTYVQFLIFKSLKEPLSNVKTVKNKIKLEKNASSLPKLTEN
jgi:hypothetical protein